MRHQRARTWAALFEPERYPPPPLSGAAMAWRYTIAVGTFFIMLAIWVALIRVRETGMFLGEPVPPEEITSGPALWLAFLDPILGLAGLATIHLRRRFPLVIAVGGQLASVASSTGAAVWVWSLISNASRRNLRNTIIVAVLVVCTALAGYLFPWSPPFTWASVAVIPVVVAGLSLLGMYIGVRRDQRAGFLRRVEQADADRAFAVLAERNRIAREMHDVLAHRISLVSMHAGVLAYRADLPPEKTREIATIIQENAHASLTELRSVLSTLRAVPEVDANGQVLEVQAAADGSVVAPQPTLADLPGLLDEAQASGQRFTLQNALDGADVPLVQQRHLYRIIQECLTNARKHAPRALIELALAGSRRDGISIRVANDLTAALDSIPGAKLGLVGITERAQMLGGRLDAGVRGGRFVVEAWIPWDNAYRRTP